jgi:hypothetical protein
MSFQHLRQRWGTTLAALALLAVSGGCEAYPTTAYSGDHVVSSYRSYPSYYPYSPRVWGGWYGDNWGAWRGGGYGYGWHHRSWPGGGWHHGPGWHHGGGPWQRRR